MLDELASLITQAEQIDGGFQGPTQISLYGMIPKILQSLSIWQEVLGRIVNITSQQESLDKRYREISMKIRFEKQFTFKVATHESIMIKDTNIRGAMLNDTPKMFCNLSHTDSPTETNDGFGI